MFGGYNPRDSQSQRRQTGITGRARVKRVFPNDMVAHVWAQQTQDEGRSGNGNFYFSGATIYSYGSHFPIARFMSETFRGNRVVLFNSRTYSVSTSGHQSDVSRALRGLNVKIFHVPQVEFYDAARAHSLNLASYISALRSHAAEMARPRKRAYFGWDSHDQIADTMERRIESLAAFLIPIREYCEAFQLTLPEFEESSESKLDLDLPTQSLDGLLESLAQTIRDAFARHNEPKRVAARAKREAKREARIAVAMQRYHAWKEGVLPRAPAIVAGMERGVKRDIKWRTYDLRADHYRRWDSERKPITVDEWHAGAGNASARLRDHDSYSVTLVRKHGDRLETSRGVDVPFEQAVAAFLFAARCRRKAESWKRNGSQFRVGQFQLDSVDADGNIRAGCHMLQWPEMLRLAVKEIPDMVRPTYPVPAIVA